VAARSSSTIRTSSPSQIQKIAGAGAFPPLRPPPWDAAARRGQIVLIAQQQVKTKPRRVPFRKRRSLIPLQRESVNSSRPEFLPMMRPVRAPDRDQGSRSRIAKLHFLRVCCSIAAPCHLPLQLSPSDGLHIEVGLAPPTQKLLHTVDMLCIDYYEACQRKKCANSWNDCHSPRVEVPRQQAQKKICWDFVHARLE
jgi:hypothetical protein